MTGHESKLITKDLFADISNTHFQFSLWKHQTREQKFVFIFEKFYDHLITQSGTLQEKRSNQLDDTIHNDTKENKDLTTALHLAFYLFTLYINIVISISKSVSSINLLIS